ncbi:MAG TPA: ATP synthase F0 subunit B [Kofleriaceae bacterium]|nr:ATP synthase F0 subunit B [Kofleriaceae bacterium]
MASYALVPSETDAPLKQEHPLIDIDHTVWIQLVLFFIVAVIGSRLLFRPYLRMRDERAAGIEGARDEATRLSAEADARLAHYDKEIAAARTRAQDERRVMRTEAATRQREATDKARADAARAYEEARNRVERETNMARQQLMPRASQVAQEIAGKLLGRGVES